MVQSPLYFNLEGFIANQIQPVLLVILDGFGYSTERQGNAIALAKTPTLDGLWRNYPHTLLSAAGEHVGLPWGATGNSEAGHLNIGAGRVVLQSFPEIEQAIETGAFFENPVLVKCLQGVKKQHSTLHLAGLLSRAGIHGHLHHIDALLQLSARIGVSDVALHLFTDGRDSEPQSAPEMIAQVEQMLRRYKVGYIASLIGRGYAMDRNSHWAEATKLAFDLLLEGVGTHYKTPAEALKSAYAHKITDEFIPASVIENQNKEPRAILKPNDGLVAFNFREDRIRQLVMALGDPEFSYFKRPNTPHSVNFVTFAPLRQKSAFAQAFPQLPLKNTLSEVIWAHGLQQFHIAETEKYAHVTYFLGGRHEEPFPGEKRVLAHSGTPASFLAHPAMRAPEIAEETARALSDNFQFGVVNFANPDMLGHTGDLGATIKAIEAVDEYLGAVIAAAQKHGFWVFVTADHGNAEQMINPETGNIDSEHTINPVPFIAVVAQWKTPQPPREPKVTGVLADVAPTILKAIGLTPPDQMTGYSLLELLEPKNS